MDGVDSMSTGHRLWRDVVRIFPEVVDFGVGAGDEGLIIGMAEVLGKDGVDDGRDNRVAGIGGEFKAVLALAVGVIEQLALRRAAEAVGLLDGIEPDDLHRLHHDAAGVKVTADCDVEGIVCAVIGDVGSDESPFPSERDAEEVIGHGAADDGGDAGA